MSENETCPTVPVQRSPQMTAALKSCEPDYTTLRLGFHSSAEAGFDSGAMHGVETAIRSIAEEGLLDRWGTTIEPFFKAVGYDDPYVVEAALELTQEDRVNAVIGGGSSGRSILGNYIFSLAGIPQVSQTSTSPLLSDKEKFPTFSRVVPPDDWQGSLLAGIVRDIGWRSISILYSTDDYARELMQIFKDTAEADGIAIRTLASFVLTEDKDLDLTSQMEQIKRAKTNINALIVGNTASALAALKSATRAGLAGPEFVWLGVDGWFSSELITAQDDPEVRMGADGSLGLVPFFQQRGEAYDKFLLEWRATPPLQQSQVGPQSPVNVSEACNAACLQTPPWGGAYSYDATKLVAKAWASVLEEGGDPRDLVSGDLLKAIRSVTLENALTGNLTLDEMGNPRSRKYDVFQLQAEDPWMAVGTIDDAEGLELYGSKSLKDDSRLNFGLGPGVVPSDGNGPVASESEEIEWLAKDPENAFYGEGDWLFAAQNTYGEWVPVTEEICEGFSVAAVNPKGDLVFNVTCDPPTDEIITRLQSEYMKTQLGSYGSQTWEDMYNQFLKNKNGDADGDPSKRTLESALCSCPLYVPSDNPKIPPDVDMYVKYGGEPLPGFNPYPLFNYPQPQNNEASKLLMIILPVVIGTFILLTCGLFVYIWQQKKKAMYAFLVNNDELEFDDPVKILGMGGMGDVVAARFRGTSVAIKRTLLNQTGLTKSTVLGTSTSKGMKDSRMSEGKKNNCTNAETDIESQEPAALKSSDRSVSFSNRSHSSVTSVHVSSIAEESKGVLGFLSCFGVKKFKKQDSFQKRLGFDSTGTSSLSSMLGTLSSPNTAITTRGRLSSLNKALFREMRIVTKLRHPNIVQTMGAVIQKGTPPMLIMELMQNGSMYSIIHNDVLPVDLEMVVGILSDAVKGLRYLHEAKPPLIHGDLKLMNILVDDRLTGKLSDFGLSCIQQGNSGVRGGSLLWMAPELLMETHPPSEMSDVYSLGITMYEIFTGFKPYEDMIEKGITAKELIKAVTEENLRPTVPPANPDGTTGRLNLQVPSEFLDLMTECWHKNPARRPSIKEIEERILEVIEDKNLARTTNTMGKQQQALLQDILPAKVIKALSEGRKVEPEAYDAVTIFFSDIVGFTTISQTLPPEKVMAMLDDMYSRFDALVRKHGLFKVETIGDAYMAVGGIPEPQQDHTLRVARFAIEAINFAADVPIDREAKGKGDRVRIRVGFHSGPVVASVVGRVNPRYCLFGDTVNVASRMESNSEAKKINISPIAHKLLMDQCPDAKCTDRGTMEIKGKGKMHCWFLEGLGSQEDAMLLNSSRSDNSLAGRSNSGRGGGKYG